MLRCRGGIEVKLTIGEMELEFSFLVSPGLVCKCELIFAMDVMRTMGILIMEPKGDISFKKNGLRREA